MASFYHLLTTTSLLSAYITRELGGEVIFDDNSKEKGVILRWKRFNPKTKKYLRFNYKITYDEVEAMDEPFAFAQTIITKYREGVKDDE